MTIYTEKPDASLPRPLSNLPAGLLESAGAAFMTGLDDGLLFSAIDIAKAKRLQAEENAPVISKNDVNTEFKKMGITSIDVPEQGLTQTYFSHVIAERKKSLQRQEILAAAPDGWIATPLRFLAHLAGNMVDPGDLALNAIPLLGPAKAATRLGRAAERFGKGAAVGGITTAAEIPVIGTGAAARGDDYGYESAVQSVLFGTVAGGVLNAGGGLIADIVGQRRARKSADAQAEHQENDAYVKAYDDVVPEFVAQQHANLNGKVADIEAVQAELTRHRQEISALESTADTGDTLGRLKQREADLRKQVEAHTVAEEAGTHLASLQSGTLPEALKIQIAQRAQAIMHQIQTTALSQPSAAQRLAEADNAIRQGAMRAAIAQAQRGEAINVSPFLDLMVPVKRKAALEALAREKPLDKAPPVQPSLNTAPLQRTEKAITETDNVKADLETELNRLEAQVQQHSDPVLASEIKALRDEVNDTSLHNAIQAAAVCMVRKSS